MGAFRHDRRHSQYFNEGMASNSPLVGTVLMRYCKDNSLVDVGGGIGTLAKEIADAFPELNCIVPDLPHVVDGLEVSNKNVSLVFCFFVENKNLSFVEVLYLKPFLLLMLHY